MSNYIELTDYVSHMMTDNKFYLFMDYFNSLESDRREMLLREMIHIINGLNQDEIDIDGLQNEIYDLKRENSRLEDEIESLEDEIADLKHDCNV